MRELTNNEAEQTAGGIGVTASVLIALVAAYTYEKLGGAKGIEEKAKAIGEHLVPAIEALGESLSNEVASSRPVG